MRVLIASGGSGGHIFPAVALAKELESEGLDIIFVASRRKLDKKLLRSAPYKKIFLSANPMPYRLNLRVFIFLAKLISDSLHAIYLVKKYRPSVVVGFGGYTSGAVILMAKLMRIETIIHEQNLVPGRTNKFLDKLANKVTVSFPEGRRYFSNKNVIFTGNPLRKESLTECREKAFTSLGLDRNKMVILVMGGSQGAKSLNKLVSKSVSGLSDAKKESIQLIHIAGVGNTDDIQKIYKENGIQGMVFEFVGNINEAYSACDLAISRSGAAAIFELAAFSKPMILIPYPNIKNNQRFNAEFFAEKGAAVYRDEKNLSVEKLKGIIDELIDSPAKRQALSANAKRLSVIDGVERLKEEILKTLNSKP